MVNSHVKTVIDELETVACRALSGYDLRVCCSALIMMTYESLMAAQQASHQAFGAMLRSWRIRNNWTQYTAHKWAKEAGFEAISYGNLSVIEQGKAGELRQKAFFQLEELNRRLAAKNYTNVKTQEIKEKLKDAKPLVDDNGKIWDAVDFWACYVGVTSVPMAYQ